MRVTKTIGVFAAAAAICFAAAPAWGQPGVGMTFSVDFQGPTAAGPGPFTGVMDGFLISPIDEGAILTPTIPGPAAAPNPPTIPPGPLPPPGLMVSPIPGGVGLILGGLGVVPEPFFGTIELDALSYGHDFQGNQLVFSVDEFATGVPLSPAPPNVFSEGVAGPAVEASADVFAFLAPLVAPIAPLGPVIGNTGIVDGDALVSATGFVYPGTGLIEPNPPTPGLPVDPGDNLDAVDMDTTIAEVALGPIYFSLSSAFPDPLEAPPANGGTAAANGFVGGDVLVSAPGAFPGLYAPAGLLGLDLLGPDSDDLDALALFDDGDGLFTPGVDGILFSVRRGSAVIGAPDSIWGAPIEEGDVLTDPSFGGLTPFPGIVVPGEAMGLATFRAFPGHFGADDLDALDVIIPEPATLSLLALGAIALIRRRRRA